MSKFPLQLPHSAMMDGPNLIHNSNTRRVGGSSAQIGQTMMDRPNLIHDFNTRWGGVSGARMPKQ